LGFATDTFGFNDERRRPTASDQKASIARRASYCCVFPSPEGNPEKELVRYIFGFSVPKIVVLPVDPTSEAENDQGERMWQRVHGASVPESRGRCKTRKLRNRAR
jgi:hypothetical protein